MSTDTRIESLESQVRTLKRMLFGVFCLVVVGCDSIARHHCQKETVQVLMTGFDACVVLRRTRGVTQWRT